MEITNERECHETEYYTHDVIIRNNCCHIILCIESVDDEIYDSSMEIPFFEDGIAALSASVCRIQIYIP